MRLSLQSLLSPNFPRKPLFPFMRDTLRVLPVFMHDCRRLAFLSCLDSTVIHTSSVKCLSVPLSVSTVPSVSTVSPDTRFDTSTQKDGDSGRAFDREKRKAVNRLRAHLLVLVFSTGSSTKQPYIVHWWSPTIFYFSAAAPS